MKNYFFLLDLFRFAADIEHKMNLLLSLLTKKDQKRYDGLTAKFELYSRLAKLSPQQALS